MAERPFPVAAGDLGNFEYCEQKAVFDRRFGNRRTAHAAQRSEDGVAAHRRFENEPQAGDRRCFVATCVYGADAPETELLRRYRDNSMMRGAWGRAMVRVYYAASPWLVRAIRPFPAVMRIARRILDRIVARIAAGRPSETEGRQ